MSNDPLIYELSKTIEYSKGGDFHQTATIELSPPSMKVFDLSNTLSQLVMRAFVDAQELSRVFEGRIDEDTGSQTDQGMDAKAIKMILLSSKKVEFNDIGNVCKKLFCRVGTYDGKIELKPSVFDKLEINDTIDMICAYIANFIFPSLF